MLTSLQSPLSDFMAENAQTCPIVGSHLYLIVSPDDEVLQQQVSYIWAGNVLDLVVNRQPSETVTIKKYTYNTGILNDFKAVVDKG